jgi:hypothetical protein
VDGAICGHNFKCAVFDPYQSDTRPKQDGPVKDVQVDPVFLTDAGLSNAIKNAFDTLNALRNEWDRRRGVPRQ